MAGAWLYLTGAGALPSVGRLIGGLPGGSPTLPAPPAAAATGTSLAPVATASSATPGADAQGTPPAVPPGAPATDALPLDPPPATRAAATSAPSPSPTPADALQLLRGSPSVPVSDLLFIAGNQLVQWQRRSLQVRVLAQSPESFVASADGAVILTLHALNLTANGLERFELRRIDPAGGGQSLVLENTPRPQMLTITADGRRAAYALAGDRTLVYVLELEPAGAAPTAPPTTSAAPPAPTAASTPGSADGGDAAPAAPIGACEALPEERCASLAWSPDGRSLAWSDGRGVWVADAATRQARLTHDPQVEVADPKGLVSKYEAFFDDLVWSPDGRFLLLRVTPKDSPAAWRAVLDVVSGKMANAGDSFAVDEAESRVAWLAHDRIMVAHASDLARATPPFIHIWNVFYTNPQLLVSGRTYELYSKEFPFSAQNSKSIPAHQVDWLSALIPGKVLFGVKLPGTDTQPVLFTLDLTTGMIVKLQTLPKETAQVIYAPDGSGALVGGPNGFVFAPLNGDPLIDLSRVFSQNVRQAQWLAPSLPRRP